MKSEAVLDFLKDAVAAAPDLPADEPKPGLKPRRKRYDSFSWIVDEIFRVQLKQPDSASSEACWLQPGASVVPLATIGFCTLYTLHP